MEGFQTEYHTPGGTNIDEGIEGSLLVFGTGGDTHAPSRTIGGGGRGWEREKTKYATG